MAKQTATAGEARQTILSGVARSRNRLLRTPSGKVENFRLRDAAKELASASYVG